MLHGNLIGRDESPISIQNHASAGSAGDFVLIPDAQLLFHAEFKRVGNDLKLTGQDGKTFLVSDYFSNDIRPKLVAPDGAGLTADIVEALAGPLAAGQYAQAGSVAANAAEVVGKVVVASGSAQIVRNGVAITVNAGDTVLKNDVVQTGDGGTVSIIFTDSTTFNLSANARMVINEFVYDPNGSANASLISLVQGTIGFVAGQVAKTGDMKVKTPVATMGIRGTAVVVEIAADNGTTKFSVTVEPITGHVGSYELRDNLTGALLGTVSNSGIGWVVRALSPTEVFAQQFTKSTEDIQKELAIIQSVFQNQSIGQQLLNYTDPNSTKTATAFIQFIVTDRLGINAGDGLTVPKTTTVKFNPGGSDPLHTQSNDGPQFINHAPIARLDLKADANSAVESGVGPGDTPFSGTPVVTGNVLANDSDEDGDVITVIGISAESPRLHAVSLTINSDGSYTYTLDNTDPEVQALAKGETLTDIYNYTITDTHGATASAKLIITIVGTNDQPVIVPGNTSATATFEETPLVTGSGDVHTKQGSIAFADVDLHDTHDVTKGDASFVWSGGQLTTTQINALLAASTMTLFKTDSTNTGTGSVGWTYTMVDGALDFLAEGETLKVSYLVTITDNNGATATQTIEIQIDGRNDSPNSTPVIVGADDTGTITENGTLSDSGSITFLDADQSDTITVTHNAADTAGISWTGGTLSSTQEAALRAGFSLDASSFPHTGTVNWAYSVSESALNFLSAGESITFTVTVSFDDPLHAQTTQTVTLTINGAEDAPSLTADTQLSHAVSETADLTNGTGTNDTATGTLAFTDVDQNDTHTASAALNQGPNAVVWSGGTYNSIPQATRDALGTALTAAIATGVAAGAPGVTNYDSTGTGAGIVKWDFSLPDNLLDFLAAGETLTLKYDVTVKDILNQTSTQTVTIEVTGANDAPVLSATTTSANYTDTAADDTFANVTGQLSSTDVDHGDTASYAITGGTIGSYNVDATAYNQSKAGTYGTLYLNSTSGAYVFVPNDGAIESLKANASETFTLTVTDSHSGPAAINYLLDSGGLFAPSVA